MGGAQRLLTLGELHRVQFSFKRILLYILQPKICLFPLSLSS